MNERRCMFTILIHCPVEGIAQIELFLRDIQEEQDGIYQQLKAIELELA